MTLHTTSIIPFLRRRGVPFAESVWTARDATAHGAASVRANGLITYEFAETLDETGCSTGFDVRVRNALI